MEWRIAKSTLIKTSLPAGLLLLLWIGICRSFIPPEARAGIPALEGRFFVMFSPDSQTAVTASHTDHEKVGPIKIWDITTGLERLAVAQDWKDIETIDVSGDSSLLAAHEKEGDLKVWSMETGTELMSFKPVTYYGNCVKFRFCPDGKSVIFKDFRGNWRETDRVTFREIASGKEWATVEADSGGIEFLDNGKRLVSLAHTDRKHLSRLKIWELDSERHRLVSTKEHVIVADGIAPSADGKAFACIKHPNSNDNPTTIEIRDTDLGIVRCKLLYTDKETDIQSLSFSANGKLLLSDGGGGNQLDWKTRSTVWDLSENPGRELASFSEAPIISHDSKWLAVPSEDGADLYEIASMKKVVLMKPGDGGLVRFIGLSDTPQSFSKPKLKFSPDGNMLAVSRLWHRSQEPLAIQWIAKHILRLPSNEFAPVLRLWDVRTGTELASFKETNEAKFSPDGKTLATVGSDGMIRFWDVPLRKPIGKVLAIALPYWGFSLLALWLIRKACSRWLSRNVAMQAWG